MNVSFCLLCMYNMSMYICIRMLSTVGTGVLICYIIVLYLLYIYILFFILFFIFCVWVFFFFRIGFRRAVNFGIFFFFFFF